MKFDYGNKKKQIKNIYLQYKFTMARIRFIE